jgi:FkbM family methyltransferase
VIGQGSKLSLGTVQTLAKRCFRAVGLEVQRLKGANTEDAILRNLLRLSRPVAVLDVGANAGQYAENVRRLGYDGVIVSFEAIPEVQRRLAQKSAKDPRWIVAPCAAIGSQNGQIEINIAANLASSSVLAMRDTHVQAAPQSMYVDKQLVRLVRLDELAVPLLPASGDLMLKIDTQGYEKEVLGGSAGLLDRVVAMQLELSLVPLYEHAPTLVEMVSYLERLGYEMFNIAPGFKREKDGRMLQVDGFFVRKGALS